jgi:hypothetical protein
MDEWILNADDVPQLRRDLGYKNRSCYSLTTYGEFDSTPARPVFYLPPYYCTDVFKAFTN